MKIKIFAVIFGGVAIPLIVLGLNFLLNKTATVTGKMKCWGKPVPGGVITFIPENGRGEVSAAISPDGTYRAEGVPVGKAKVVIASRPRLIRLAIFERIETTTLSVPIQREGGVGT